MWLKLMTPIVI